MKTNELTDNALNWAVAKCEGLLAFGWEDDMGLLKITLSTGETEYFIPTMKWEQGGPIIEREIAKIERFSDALWEATAFTKNAQDIVQDGPTPLIAAMRAYVASKLGDDVDVPDEMK
jgi:hypothetical protein